MERYIPFLDTSSLKVVERLPGWKGRFFHTAGGAAWDRGRGRGPRALSQLSIESAPINHFYKEGAT